MTRERLRADFEQLSRTVERMDAKDFVQLVQGFVEYEREHPEASNSEMIAIDAAEEFARFMQGRRTLGHPLIEYRWRLHAVTDALAQPTMMYFLIYTICRALVDGQGDLLQELDELIETMQSELVRSGLPSPFF